MEAGLIGLGKMGLHIAMNMQSSGIRAYGYDIQTGPRKQAKAKGISVVQTLQELIAALQKPRIIWLMLPAGDITESMVHQLAELLEEGDYVIDGGNSFYRAISAHFKNTYAGNLVFPSKSGFQSKLSGNSVF